jgi:DnaJ-class molecular chaperone
VTKDASASDIKKAYYGVRSPSFSN